MKNPAGLLALAVLAIATILMVFFVLPRINGDGTETGKPATEAAGTTSAPAAEPAAPAEPPATAAETTAKTDRPATPDAPAAEPAPADQQAAPAAPAPDTAAPQDTAAAPQTSPPAVAPAPDLSRKPAFDVLRVEPDGSAVIAGKAAPGSKLEIMDGDTPIASTDIGDGGDFAIVLDAPLAPGDHQLVLKLTGKDGKVVVSDEVATVSVPSTPGGELLAMIGKPGEASRIITAPVETPATVADAAKAETTPPAAEPVAAAAPAVPEAPAEVRVTAVEIEADKIFVAGIARPGAAVAGYANDALIGKSTTDKNGHFLVEGTVPLSVGQHTISVDVIGADGKVEVRASVPFTRPAGQQVAAVAPQAPAADAAQIGQGRTGTGQTSAAPAAGDGTQAQTVPAGQATTPAMNGEPKTIAQAPLTESSNAVIIRRGDTLWQISRRVYGRGVRYTTIYVANREQIANPDRIQPGQIFGVPKEATMPDTDAEQIHRKQILEHRDRRS